MPLSVLNPIPDSPDSWWTASDGDAAPGWATMNHDDDEGACDGTMWDAPSEHDRDLDRGARVADHYWVIDDDCACIDVLDWFHARAGETLTLVPR